MAIDPTYVTSIARAAKEAGVPADLSLAIALEESGGNARAVGDQGSSYGAYQLHRGGALGSRTPQQAFDPYQNAMAVLPSWAKAGGGVGLDPRSALYQYYSKVGRGSSNDIPTNRAFGLLPRARQLLAQYRGAGGASAVAGGGAARSLASDAAGGSFSLSPQTMKTLTGFLARSEKQALAGKIPSLSDTLAMVGPLLKGLNLGSPQGLGGLPGLPPTAAGADAGPATWLGDVVQPVAGRVPTTSQFNYVDAEGAPDANGTRHHAAVDWFAPAGTPVRSPVAGRVVEVRPSKGTSGQIFGGTVKVQDPQGRVFVFRHTVPGGVRVGQQVQAGAPIASVSPWTGGSTHTHIEIWKTLGGGYRYENMVDPLTVFRQS